MSSTHSDLTSDRSLLKVALRAANYMSDEIDELKAAHKKLIAASEHRQEAMKELLQEVVALREAKANAVRAAKLLDHAITEYRTWWSDGCDVVTVTAVKELVENAQSAMQDAHELLLGKRL